MRTLLVRDRKSTRITLRVHIPSRTSKTKSRVVFTCHPSCTIQNLVQIPVDVHVILHHVRTIKQLQPLMSIDSFVPFSSDFPCFPHLSPSGRSLPLFSVYRSMHPSVSQDRSFTDSSLPSFLLSLPFLPFPSLLLFVMSSCPGTGPGQPLTTHIY